MNSIRDQWLGLLEKILHKQILPYNIKVGGDNILFFPNEIIRFRADGAYTQIITLSESLIISRNINCLKDELKGWGMIKVNRSNIINVCHIKRIIQGKNSYILMSDNSKIIIPSRKKAILTKK